VITVHLDWDERLWQTQRLLPLHAVAALIEWSGLPDAAQKPPHALRVAVVECCIRNRSVAFRLQAGEQSTAGTIICHPAARSWALEIARRLLGRRMPDVVIATSILGAVDIFEHGWDLQAQAALYLDDPGSDRTAARALATTSDWRKAELPDGAALLMAPAVDGDAILVAARSREHLARLLADFSLACASRGLAINLPPIAD
jgi:hypothetical protein